MSKKLKKKRVEKVRGGGEYAHSFIIFNGENSAVVDCGNSAMARRILDVISESEISESFVKWVILTHTHYDHSKGVKKLMEGLSCAKVVVHSEEYENLIKGEIQFPKPTRKGRNLDYLQRNPEKYFTVDKFSSDQLVEFKGNELKLSEEILLLWTPGHSKGSICIFFQNSILMGDIIECYNGKGCYPSFSDDMELMFKSWKKLIDLYGDEEDMELLPSHGISTRMKWLIVDYERYGK